MHACSRQSWSSIQLRVVDKSWSESWVVESFSPSYQPALLDRVPQQTRPAGGLQTQSRLVPCESSKLWLTNVINDNSAAAHQLKDPQLGSTLVNLSYGNLSSLGVRDRLYEESHEGRTTAE